MITTSPTFCPAPWTSLNIDQTGRVIAQFGHKFNLAIDTLKGYQKTLIDNDYLTDDYCPNALRFHTQIEATLRKETTFEQLWPTLAQQARNINE